MMRARARIGVLVLGALGLPAAALAQATLTGTVRDSSGAVLPGVTVEAASPALIERVRTTVTDGTGQYRIVELRPGTYTLTFLLAGFTTVQRAGVQLTGSAVTVIDAEMRLSAIEETVTVTGETPVVDVQSTRRQAVLTNEVINALPASRGYGNLLMAIPSVSVNLLNSGTDPTMQFFTVHGGRSNEGTVQIAGMNVGSAFNGGGVSSFAYDTSNAAEVQFVVSGGLGEADSGGPAVNIIPREGGNQFSATAFLNAAGSWSQGSNLDDRLRSFGISENPELIRSWDASYAMGGPILRDRLWFFGTGRSFGTATVNAGLFPNKNAGNPASWSYEPDQSVQSRAANSKLIGAARLTGQVTPRNKLSAYLDYQHNCGGSTLTLEADGCRKRGKDWVALGNFFGITSPESGTVWDDREIIAQATWTSPATNRLLLEAGFSSFISRWGGQDPGGALIDFIPVTEQIANERTRVPFNNFMYRGLNNRFGNNQKAHVWRASASYVTGAHALKIGMQGAYLIHLDFRRAGTNWMAYRFANGVPNQFEMFLPRTFSNRTTSHALYVQDQWTVDRFTLQAGLRYERAWSWHPEGENGVLEVSRFNPARIVFPRTESVRGYNDFSPRIGASYDLFGDGRTAVKVHFGHYLQRANNEEVFVINGPAVTFQRNTTRSWVDGNGNFVPDCDLMNPAAQDNRAAGGDFCGPWSNLNFGSQFNTTRVNPAVLEGWGVRPFDWQVSLGIQHEVLPRVSVDISYNRRSFRNFFYTDNRAVGPQDFDRVTITAPRHPGLPNGGGYPVTFHTIKPEKFGQVDNYFTFAEDFGRDTRYWHGVDVTINARTTWGLVLQAGTSTGRGVRDNCEITAKLPEIVGAQQVDACHVTEYWLTNLRGLASYNVPVADVLVSAIIRSQPAITPANTVATSGSSLAANFIVSSAQVQQAIGRPLAGGAANTTVNLLRPGQLYPDRLNAVDVRLAKIVRFGRNRTDIGVDLYNLFNSNTGTAFNQNFGVDGSSWLRPTQILNPRFVRFNVTYTF